MLVGLAVVDRPGVMAAMMTPVDQPFVSEATVRLLVDTWRRLRAPIVRPVRDDRHGHPVIFDRSTFDALRRADPSEGAKAVVRAHAARLCDVVVEDAAAFEDIDTPADYERWTGLRL
jgi:molybdenum cofactor cytidylyltransferase